MFFELPALFPIYSVQGVIPKNLPLRMFFRQESWPSAVLQTDLVSSIYIYDMSLQHAIINVCTYNGDGAGNQTGA